MDQRTTKKLFLLVPLLILAGVATPWGLRMYRNSQIGEAVAPAVKRHGAVKWEEHEDGIREGTLHWGSRPQNVPNDELPVIAGGVLLMRPDRDNFGTGKKRTLPAQLDPLHFELPDDLRADAPGEVKTLVHMVPQPRSASYVREGSNLEAATLTQMVVLLDIYDVASQQHLGRWLLYGDTPPDSFYEDEWPDLDAPPVVEFIQALPRR